MPDDPRPATFADGLARMRVARRVIRRFGWEHMGRHRTGSRWITRGSMASAVEPRQESGRASLPLSLRAPRSSSVKTFAPATVLAPEEEPRTHRPRRQTALGSSVPSCFRLASRQGDDRQQSGPCRLRRLRYPQKPAMRRISVSDRSSDRRWCTHKRLGSRGVPPRREGGEVRPERPAVGLPLEANFSLIQRAQSSATTRGSAGVRPRHLSLMIAYMRSVYWSSG